MMYINVLSLLFYFFIFISFTANARIREEARAREEAREAESHNRDDRHTNNHHSKSAHLSKKNGINLSSSLLFVSILTSIINHRTNERSLVNVGNIMVPLFTTPSMK